MTDFEERFDEKTSKLAEKRATYQATSGCKHLDAAVMRFLCIGGEDMALSLKPLIVEMRESLDKLKDLNRQYTIRDVEMYHLTIKTLAKVDEFFDPESTSKSNDNNYKVGREWLEK